MRLFLCLVAATTILSAPLSAQPVPGTGGGSAQAGNVDFKNILLGTWYYEGMTGPTGYQVWTTIKVEYMADNTYRGTLNQQMPGLPPSPSVLAGRYSIQPVSADSFMLTHMPFQGYGTNAAEMKFIDSNTLLNLQTNATSRRAS